MFPRSPSMTEGPTIDVTKMSDKGQVVIPKEVRDRLHLGPGTKLIVVATDDAVVLQKIEDCRGQDEDPRHHGHSPQYL